MNALNKIENLKPDTLISNPVGTPVVSFANGGVVQFAASGSDGPAARVVPYLDVAALVDALAELGDDPVARKALGERARDVVTQDYLTEVAAPRLLRTLEQVVPGLRGPARRRRTASSR